MSSIKTYLENLIEEKANISMDSEIQVMGNSGMNYMSVGVIVEHILIAPKHEQEKIKNMLIKIDFHNASIMHYFNHLAQAIAR